MHSLLSGVTRRILVAKVPHASAAAFARGVVRRHHVEIHAAILSFVVTVGTRLRPDPMGSAMRPARLILYLGKEYQVLEVLVGIHININNNLRRGCTGGGDSISQDGP